MAHVPGLQKATAVPGQSAFQRIFAIAAGGREVVLQGHHAARAARGAGPGDCVRRV
jgi:hypothetical protein